MKKITYILAALLFCNISLLFASNGYRTAGNSSKSNIENPLSLTMATLTNGSTSSPDLVPDPSYYQPAELVPLTPSEAGFEDSDTSPANSDYFILNLQPENPSSADFEEPVLTPAIDIVKFAPVLPNEAGFDESK